MKHFGALAIATSGDRELVITRSFAAPRTLVFDAYTKPELVRRWLLGPPGWTMPECTIDLRVGGRFRYVWRSSTGKHMALGGVFLVVEPPARLSTSQLFDDDWTGGEAVSMLVLKESGGRTTLTDTITYASFEARAAALATGMTEGMEAGYLRLDALLAGEPGGSP